MNTLLACIIYCALLSLCAVMWFSSSAYSCRHMMAMHQSAHASMSLIAAHDLFARDVRNAVRWHITNTHECIFQTMSGKDISWLLKKHKLLRIEGHYFPEHKSWTQRTTSVVLAKVLYGSFHMTAANSLTSVGLHITVPGYTSERIVWLS